MTWVFPQINEHSVLDRNILDDFVDRMCRARLKKIEMQAKRYLDAGHLPEDLVVLRRTLNPMEDTVELKCVVTINRWPEQDWVSLRYYPKV